MATPDAKPVGRMPTYSATRCVRNDVEIEMSPSMSSRRSPASLIASAAASAARPSADRLGQERLCAVSPMPTMAVFPRKLIPYLRQAVVLRPIVHRCYQCARHQILDSPVDREGRRRYFRRHGTTETITEEVIMAKFAGVVTMLTAGVLAA